MGDDGRAGTSQASESVSIQRIAGHVSSTALDKVHRGVRGNATQRTIVKLVRRNRRLLVVVERTTAYLANVLNSFTVVVVDDFVLRMDTQAIP